MAISGIPTASPAASVRPGAKVDGRRERSATSRRRILAALVALLEDGEPSPTAESIAAEAGVSLRTVFRHFEEMENLHLEIADMVFARIRPLVEQPLEQTDWPGALFDVLSPFARHGISMNRIESRPSHHAKWEYGFFIDLAGHIDDEAMKQALAELKQHSAQIKVLGSYPVAVP